MCQIYDLVTLCIGLHIGAPPAHHSGVDRSTHVSDM
jgi:hypothetical protein